MVLNTSLNIKGMPIVNTHNDGIEFEKKKLHLKSMGIDVIGKEREEIENLYLLYENTVLSLGC